MNRRDFFSNVGQSAIAKLGDSLTTLGAGLGMVTLRSDAAAADSLERRSDRLRPPGARPEPEFLAACTRCTDCLEACPHSAIRRLGAEYGAKAHTPVVIPDESPCYLCDDMPCITACAPGALQPTQPKRVRMGLAVVANEACYAFQQQPCDYCVVRCPLGSKAIRLDPAGLPVVDPNGCAGCGVCAYLCPPSAIRIERDPGPTPYSRRALPASMNRSWSQS